VQIFDKKLQGNVLRYLLQCALATVFVLVVLAILHAIASAAIIAALGASSFIAFAMPRKEASRARYLVGGYLVGMASGTLCHIISQLPVLQQLPLVQEYSHIVFGAVAVGVAIFTMAVTNTEHPPASGVALGLVLGGELNFVTLVVLLVGIVSLAVIKSLMKPVLIDLV